MSPLGTPLLSLRRRDVHVGQQRQRAVTTTDGNTVVGNTETPPSLTVSSVTPRSSVLSLGPAHRAACYGRRREDGVVYPGGWGVHIPGRSTTLPTHQGAYTGRNTHHGSQGASLLSMISPLTQGPGSLPIMTLSLGLTLRYTLVYASLLV